MRAERERDFDAQAMMTRAGEVARYVRKSDAFPVLAGGVAGGIAGALMAVLIAGRIRSSSRRAVAEEVANAVDSEGHRWSMREVVQLATIAATLAKQAQAWYNSRKETDAYVSQRDERL